MRKPYARKRRYPVRGRFAATALTGQNEYGRILPAAQSCMNWRTFMTSEMSQDYRQRDPLHLRTL